MTDHAAIVAEKTADLAAAEREYRTIDAEMKAAIDAATKAIREQYRDRVNTAQEAVWQARTAADQAKIEAANSHPLIGKKVEKTISKPLSKWSSKSKMVTVYGIVEVMTEYTEMPANMGRWRRPDAGEVFVRLLKNDGTTGKNIEALHQGWQESK